MWRTPQESSATFVNKKHRNFSMLSKAVAPQAESISS
jgi:hypothetical protein